MARPIAAPALVAALLCTLPSPGPALAQVDPYASAPPYVRVIDPDALVEPLVTTGQLIPLQDGTTGQTFRVIGVPDGLGLRSLSGDTLLLEVNHELAPQQGAPAGPLASGARISQLVLEPGSDPWAPPAAVSGRYAIEVVHDVAAFDSIAGDHYAVVPAPGPFTYFCSTHLAGPDEGFDRYVHLNGEEAEPGEGLDGQGGLGWATTDGHAYCLRRLGRAVWENVVAARGTGVRTVVFGFDDAPTTGNGLNAQLYMYVGEKLPAAPDPMAINGLSNGRLHVLAGDNPSVNSEIAFATKGASTSGHWEEVDWWLGASALESAAQGAGAFGFVRIEDGAPDPVQDGVIYFATTGWSGQSANRFGRLYRLDFDPSDPLAGAVLTLLLDGSEGMVNPDNLDVNVHGEIMIQEDPTYDLETGLGLQRDSSIWWYCVASGDLLRVVEIDRPAAIAHALAADPRNTVVAALDRPGKWETSGIIDAERFHGRGAWIFTVQAHALRIHPSAETVEGGQVLFLRYVPALVDVPGEATGSATGEPVTPGPGEDPGALRIRSAPDPFVDATRITLAMPEPGAARVVVFDVAGRMIRGIHDGWLGSGRYEWIWNGTTDGAGVVAPGVYLIEARSGGRLSRYAVRRYR